MEDEDEDEEAIIQKRRKAREELLKVRDNSNLQVNGALISIFYF
jgi:hypothetical protein